MMTTVQGKAFRYTKLFTALSLSTGFCLATTANAEDIVEEVTVTGSYIQSTPGDEARPVQILNNEYISSIGANSLADVISKLAINNGSENQADSFTQGGTQGTSNVNLRGLGLSSTLVLINGRRQTFSGAITNDGSVFVDSSSIPVEALERVEVLKEGASSTYGSDAIAGVVNYILKKDFQGFEVNVGYQDVEHGGQRDTDVGFVWGVGNDTTNFMVSGHYLDRNPLNGGERPQLIDNAFSSLGNSFLLFGAQDGTQTGAGTLYERDTPYQTFETVPVYNCEEVRGGIIVSTGGCGYNFGPDYNLVNREIRRQLYANLSHSFSDSLDVLLEYGIAQNDVKDNPQSPSFPDLSFPVVPAYHPSNPFGNFVLLLGRPLNGETESPLAPRENNTERASLTVDAALSDAWSLNSAVTYSKNEYTQSFWETSKSRFTAALFGLGGSDPANNPQFFDPFIPSNNSQDVLDDIARLAKLKRTTELTVVDSVLAGELFELNGNTVGAAFGIQWREEVFTADPNENYEATIDEQGNLNLPDLIFLGGFNRIDTSRDAFAAFAEFNAPVTDDFEINAAIRYEDLQNSESIDPKLAARWQINDAVTLRASASTAFREPSMAQQYASSAVLTGLQDKDADGNAVGQTAFAKVAARGTEDLKPEQSTNFNVGLVMQPSDAFNIKFDYWSVDYKDLITVESAQGKIDSNPADPDIIRSSFNVLQQVNVDFFNSSSVEVDGIDIEVFYAPTDTFTAGLNSSYLLNYDITLPDGSKEDAAGFFNVNNFARSLPEWKATAYLMHATEKQNVSAHLNYISSYDLHRDEADLNGFGKNSINAFTTVDFQYGINLDTINDDSALVTIGIKNVFDRRPPRVTLLQNLSYDPKQHNPLGRVFYGKITYSF